MLAICFSRQIDFDIHKKLGFIIPVSEFHSNIISIILVWQHQVLVSPFFLYTNSSRKGIIPVTHNLNPELFWDVIMSLGLYCHGDSRPWGVISHHVNTMRAKQMDQNCANDICKCCILFIENVCIWIKMSLTFALDAEMITNLPWILQGLGVDQVMNVLIHCLKQWWPQIDASYMIPQTTMCWYLSYNPVHRWHMNLVYHIPADVVAPTGARTSAGTVLKTKLYIIVLQFFLFPLMISYFFLLIIYLFFQNDWQNPVRYQVILLIMNKEQNKWQPAMSQWW